MIDVRNKWCFITGASRGIGFHAAEYMASCGANLVLHARSIESLENAHNQLKKYGIKIHLISCELSHIDEVKAMLTEIDSLGVNVELLLNNAGMQIGYRENYFDTPVNDFEESFLVNTIAPTIITYHFLPKMIKAGFGRIVNVTSGIALEPQQAGYSASKAALDKVTIDLASTVNGTDVMINLADPGWCQTDLGGPNAPNSPISAIPGIVLGLFSDDKISGRIISSQDYAFLDMSEALSKLS